MESLIKLIIDNGIGVVCVAYLIYFQCTTMRSMLSTMEHINNRLTRIETKLDIEEEEDDCNE